MYNLEFNSSLDAELILYYIFWIYKIFEFEYMSSEVKVFNYNEIISGVLFE